MTISYNLRKPIEHNGTTYQTLTFREANTGDMVMADKFEGQTGKIVAILASMSGVPLPAFHKIPQRDLLKIVDATAALMGEDEEADGAAKSRRFGIRQPNGLSRASFTISTG